MPNTISSRVISLLAQWEERQEAGEVLSPEELCKNSPELLNQVKAQLLLLNDFPNHSDSTGDFDPDLTTDDQPAKATFKDLTGTIIANRYRLTKLVGEGGMGSVWQAEQSQPVKRQVALKLIRNTTRTSAQVIRRFEAERQALALMDHPGIARIYDGGVTEWKDPYFVMELVPGVPLTEYCDNKRLSVKQRLELFVSICQAVQHAHQKGIIHRDLKPGNILVAEVDGKPVPKVIDFGVAKATEQKLTEETINDFGAVVGTLAYMSPEQADAGTVDIDTRTDVYALGVILFELLAGSTPLDTKQYKKMALRELLRLISDVEPPRLSAKLSSAENLPNLAATRSTEPSQLTKAVQGDLEWIVLKALEKDRARRYETATGFAADVQRHLAGEAVLAHPPSRWYLLKKFVKRNRAQVLALGLLVSTLVAGLTTSLWQMNRALDAEAAAVQESHNKDVQRIRAELSEKAAKETLEQLSIGNETISSIFDDLNLTVIKAGKEPLEVVLANRLVKAASALKGSSIGDPLVVAQLQDRLGKALLSLGKSQDAIPFFKQAFATRVNTLGSKDQNTLSSMNNLAVAYKNIGDYDSSLPLLEESHRISKEQWGDTHPDTIKALSSLAVAYHETGKIDKALGLQNNNLKTADSASGIQRNSVLAIMNNLAVAYHDNGEVTKAMPLYEATFNIRLKSLGHTHPDTLTSMNNLAEGYFDMNKMDKAIELYQDTIRLRKEYIGGGHVDTLASMSNLSLAYQKIGKMNEAITLMEDAVQKSILFQGKDNIDTVLNMNNLAALYKDTGRHDKSLPLLEDAYSALLKANFRSQHSSLIVNNLVGCQETLGKLIQAEAVRRKWVDYVRGKHGNNSTQYADQLAGLGQNFLKQQKWNEAEMVLRECLAIREKVIPGNWTIHSVQSMIGRALLGKQDYANSEHLLLAGIEGLILRQDAIGAQRSFIFTQALDRLIQLYTETNKPDEVKKWQAEKKRLSEQSPVNKE